MEIHDHGGPGRLAQALASYAAASGESHTLRAMLDHLPVVAFRIDPEGRLAESSGLARAAIVAERGDSRGRLVREAYADFPEILDALDRAQAGETVEFQIAIGGREYRTVYRPLPDGSIVGVALELRPLAGAAPEAFSGPGVLVVDPRARVRAGLATQLAAEGLRISAQAEGASAAMGAVDAGVRVVVLGSRAGVEPLLRIRAAFPDVFVLALIPRLTPQAVAWWQERGAHGVLGAEATGAEVADAVGILARYGVFVADASYVGVASGDVLTTRQRQIACLLARDMNRAQIAAELDIAASTVSATTSSARKRLGVTTDVGLALYAVREGWVEVDDL